MCIEVYSNDQPIQIPYANLTIRFLSHSTIRMRYVYLVRNAGYQPIQSLSVLCPRPLLRLVRVAEGDEPIAFRTDIAGVIDRTAELPQLDGIGDRFRVLSGNRLRALIPDPNQPVSRLPDLEGFHAVNNVRWAMPPNTARRGVMILQSHRFAAWIARLERPIERGDAHWYCWEIDVDDARGVLEETVLSRIVFHEISSPIDARRKLREVLQTDLRDLHENESVESIQFHSPELRRLLYDFRLMEERLVDIRFLEIWLQPGDPRKQLLIHHTQHGEIRASQRSPRVGLHPVTESGFIGEPAYEWHAGSMLKPIQMGTDSGFSLRLSMLCPGPTNRKPRRRREGS